ncbi:protein phosphatase 2C domain-containing protein, partial [Vibrio makurazakiensis]
MDQAFGMPVINSSDTSQVGAQLQIRFGGCSLQGRRDENQDALIVKHPTSLSERELKGSIACIADGVSCSEHGQQASHTSVMQFVSDYYATPQSWTVKHSAQKVLTALNSWLFNSSQKQSLNHNGLVTTFSTIIFKSNTAHLFHVGDSRIYLYRDNKLRLLTRDHQRAGYGNNQYLTRALGMDSKLDIDYQTLTLKQGDLFLLTTDGIHDYLTDLQLTAELLNQVNNAQHADQVTDINSKKTNKNGFENLTQNLCHRALANNSKDNISALAVEVTELPSPSRIEFQKQLESRIIPPALKENNVIDGFQVEKVIYAGARSHVYLVKEIKTHQQYVLKAPSQHYRDDQSTLNNFYNEQWAGMHLSSSKIMKVFPTPTESKFLYQLCEPINGISLRQWIHDNPTPTI